MGRMGPIGLILPQRKKAETQGVFRLFNKDLAPTYSRGGYTTTTIGNVVFDGRVRDGNGSDHNFMGTKKSYKVIGGLAFKGLTGHQLL